MLGFNFWSLNFIRMKLLLLINQSFLNECKNRYKHCIKFSIKILKFISFVPMHSPGGLYGVKQKEVNIFSTKE